MESYGWDAMCGNLQLKQTAPFLFFFMVLYNGKDGLCNKGVCIKDKSHDSSKNWFESKPEIQSSWGLKDYGRKHRISCNMSG